MSQRADLQMYHKHEDVTWNSVSIPLYIVHVSSLSIKLLMSASCVIQSCGLTEKKEEEGEG